MNAAEANLIHCRKKIWRYKKKKINHLDFAKYHLHLPILLRFRPGGEGLK